MTAIVGERLVAYICGHYIMSKDHDRQLHCISLTYFAVDGVGDVRINSPDQVGLQLF